MSAHLVADPWASQRARSSRSGSSSATSNRPLNRGAGCAPGTSRKRTSTRAVGAERRLAGAVLDHLEARILLRPRSSIPPPLEIGHGQVEPSHW